MVDVIFLGYICMRTFTVSRKCPDRQASMPDMTPLLKSTRKLFMGYLILKIIGVVFNSTFKDIVVVEK